MYHINSFLREYGNSVVFGSALLEESGLPLPATPVFLAAGMAAGAGILHLPTILSLAIGGFLIGDILWYYLGLWRGRQILTFLCRLSMEPDSCVRHTEERFLRYGPSSLIVAKFIPGINTVIRPLAAISGISLLRFVLYDGIGVVAYVGAFMGLGYVFSDRADDLERLMGSAHRGLEGLVVLLAAYVLYRYIRRRQFLKNLDRTRLPVDELKGKLDKGFPPVIIVDLRSPLERKAFPFMLPGARTMSNEDVHQSYALFPRESEIVLYCNCPGEIGSARVALFLQKHGYQARPLARGIDEWKEKQYPLVELPNS